MDRRWRVLQISVCLLAAIFGPGLRQSVGQERSAPLLVVVSVDGLRPDYVTAADAHGAKVPNLREFLKGTYADGVTGVVPTVTYPGNTTLWRGVWPRTQGFLATS